MAAVALDNLRTLLRDRGFAGTLPGPRVPARMPAATGVAVLDTLLGGGFARGSLTEISGALSSGGTSVALAAVATAVALGEAVAYIDATDSFHPQSAAQAGIALQRLLLVRCRWPREAWDAVNLVVGAGGFGLIVLDLLGAASPRQLREWRGRPWLKLQRGIEHTATSLLILSPRQHTQQGGLCAQAPAARLELCGGCGRWRGQDGVSLTLNGLDSTAHLAYQRSLAASRQPPRKELQCTLSFEAFEPELRAEAAPC